MRRIWKEVACTETSSLTVQLFRDRRPRRSTELAAPLTRLLATSVPPRETYSTVRPLLYSSSKIRKNDTTQKNSERSKSTSSRSLHHHSHVELRLFCSPLSFSSREGECTNLLGAAPRSAKVPSTKTGAKKCLQQIMSPIGNI